MIYVIYSATMHSRVTTTRVGHLLRLIRSISSMRRARTRRVRRLVAVIKDQDDNGGRNCVRRDGRLVQKKNFCATRLAPNFVLAKNHPHPCSVMGYIREPVSRPRQATMLDVR
ncbi:uncharacterized protein LOC141529740 [Cotesia typhae]|uniref:uncharacterized protein LOC141529740 n=1 Tax=Cotesia typhae TaxID=2053667 RepID=UPI003D69A359